MKTLSLENLGVQELNAMEMLETDGGWWREVLREFFKGGLMSEAWEHMKTIGKDFWEFQTSGNGWNGSMPGFGPH